MGRQASARVGQLCKSRIRICLRRDIICAPSGKSGHVAKALKCDRLLLTQWSDGWATPLRGWHGNASVLPGLMAGVIEIGSSTWVSYGVCGVQEHSP